MPADLRAPRTVEETGLPFLFLTELLAKVLFQRGQMRLPELAAHLKLSVGVIDPLVAFLRTEKLCEVARVGGSGTDADLSYVLTDAGRARAAAAVGRNAYAGPAPVTLAAYTAQVAVQSVAEVQVTRAAMAATFDGVVVNQRVLAQLGAAMNSGRALFLHGLAGSGKTYLAERLRDLLRGTIAVPYALMVDGEVIPFYDSVQHVVEGECAARTGSGLDRGAAPDARWVRCVRRPAALAGGELTLDMLDLRFDPHTRLYQAPPHLKSNGGIFIIDDLGRQRCTPEALMNRWIVPMDRNVDYLTLHTGHTFQVPFDVIVVFSSNFVPQRLSDGAFLRRLGYKIEVPPASTAEYAQLFRQACAHIGLTVDQGRLAQMFDYLLELHRRHGVALLACYPRDLVRQLRDLARFEERAPALDRHTLDWAWENYFAAGAPGRSAELDRRERGTLVKDWRKKDA
jgi:predicted ATPase with chaperone activity